VTDLCYGQKLSDISEPVDPTVPDFSKTIARREEK
jgi:hypothetical protein